jgi:hypothetical protein
VTTIWIDATSGTWGDAADLWILDVDEDTLDSLDHMTDFQISAFAVAHGRQVQEPQRAAVWHSRAQALEADLEGDRLDNDGEIARLWALVNDAKTLIPKENA